MRTERTTRTRAGHPPGTLGKLLVVLLVALSAPASALAQPEKPAEPRGESVGRADAKNMKLLANVPSTGGDVAFWGDIAVVGQGAESREGNGFVLLDIDDPTSPRYLGEFRCRYTWDDLSVRKDLVFLTVNVTLEGTACDAPRWTGGDGAFSGLRIVSIADPRRPVQIATVNQDCTTPGVPGGTSVKDWINHTTYPDLDHEDASGRRAPRLLVATAGGCGGEIVEVPLRAPRQSRVIGKVDTGAVLACHDLSVLVPRGLAAVGCFTETQIWDLSDPERPKVISRIVNPEISGHHGTGFSWDGDTLVIADERGGVQARPTREKEPTCAATSDGPVFGHIWFYDVKTPASPEPLGYYELEGLEEDVCSPHAFNVVPLRDGRDVVVIGWYAMGTRVIDFTDPAHPKEVAHYAVLEGPAEHHSHAWASYWYNGRVYASNYVHNSDEGTLNRGFDVLSVEYPPLESAKRVGHLNPQTYEFLIPGR